MGSSSKSPRTIWKFHNRPFCFWTLVSLFLRLLHIGPIEHLLSCLVNTIVSYSEPFLSPSDHYQVVSPIVSLLMPYWASVSPSDLQWPLFSLSELHWATGWYENEKTELLISSPNTFYKSHISLYGTKMLTFYSGVRKYTLSIFS